MAVLDIDCITVTDEEYKKILANAAVQPEDDLAQHIQPTNSSPAFPILHIFFAMCAVTIAVFIHLFVLLR